MYVYTRHFANSLTVSLTLAWSYTCKLLNMGRKLKVSLEIPILTHELYIFTRKDLCFGTGRKSFAKYFLSEFSFLKINPRRKNYISGYIWQRSFIHSVKCSFLDAKFVYESFYDAPFTFSYFFTSRKSSVFRTRQQVACEMFICYLSKALGAPCWKKIISGCFWLELFIQNGKMLFL